MRTLTWYYQELHFQPHLCLHSELELYQSLIPRITAPARILNNTVKSLVEAGSNSAHSCLNSSPRLCTNTLSLFSHSVTPTEPTPGAAGSVRFFGLDLTSQGAEVALYVLLAISAVGALGLALFAYTYRKSSKRSHKQSHMELSSKL